MKLETVCLLLLLAGQIAAAPNLHECLYEWTKTPLIDGWDLSQAKTVSELSDQIARAEGVTNYNDWYISKLNIFARPDYTFSGVQMQTTLVNQGQSFISEGRFFGYNYPNQMQLNEKLRSENQVVAVQYWISD